MKTNKLTGVALDWAVAKCEGAVDFRFDTVATYWVTLGGKDRALRSGWAQSYLPSTDWAQGGPIIERERLELASTDDTLDDDKWMSWSQDGYHVMYGTNLLIAAMRCYVVSKLGYDVDIPSELLK